MAIEINKLNTDMFINDYYDRFSKHMLELEKEMWIPTINISNNKEMKTIKVIPDSKEHTIKASEVNYKLIYLYHVNAKMVGCVINKLKEDYRVQWSDGSVSESSSTVSGLINYLLGFDYIKCFAIEM